MRAAIGETINPWLSAVIYFVIRVKWLSLCYTCTHIVILKVRAETINPWCMLRPLFIRLFTKSNTDPSEFLFLQTGFGC